MNCVPMKMAEQTIRLELIGGFAINPRSMPHDSRMLSIDVLVLGHQRNAVVSCLRPNATTFHAFVQRLPLLGFSYSVENSSFWYHVQFFENASPDHDSCFPSTDAHGCSKPTLESTINSRKFLILLSRKIVPYKLEISLAVVAHVNFRSKCHLRPYPNNPKRHIVSEVHALFVV